jgi:hypothetical protein
MVLRAKEFGEAITYTAIDAQSRLDNALKSENISAAGLAEKRFREFNAFTKIVDDLEDGVRSPTGLLRYRGLTTGGAPVFVLISGRWCAGYIVVNNVCTATSLSEMSSREAFKEMVLSPFRRRLR